MFQAKYKAHRLVNIIFYLIVFFIGFYLGTIGKKNGFEELFSKFLFIENVSAYHEDSSFYEPPTRNVENGTWKDTAYLVDLFNYVNDYYSLGLSFSNYSNVLVFNDTTGNPRFDFLFSSTPLTGNAYDFITNSPYLYISYNTTAGSSYIWSTTYDNTLSSSHNSNYYVSASNMDMTGVTYTLDFAFVDYTFNSNYFANELHFKRVCINPYKPFVVSSTQLFNNKKIFRDYLWFGGEIIGLQTATLYTDSGTLTDFEEFSLNETFFNSSNKINDFAFQLSTQQTGISSFVGVPLSTNYLTSNMYNFLYWSAFPFTLNYSSEVRKYPVFRFRENFITLVYNENSNTIHGGATRTHYDLTNTTQDLEMCFYVNNIYELTTLEQDANGFYYAVIPTPDGDLYFYSNGQFYDFFGNFDKNTYGLSGIISAPLNSIRMISSGTCQPQTITILNKTITLPCGDTLFWNRQDVQPFRVFWNMFFGGILCYGMGVSLFNSIKHFKDPDEDKVEVIDL